MRSNKRLHLEVLSHHGEELVKIIVTRVVKLYLMFLFRHALNVVSLRNETSAFKRFQHQPIQYRGVKAALMLGANGFDLLVTRATGHGPNFFILNGLQVRKYLRVYEILVK